MYLCEFITTRRILEKRIFRFLHKSNQHCPKRHTPFEKTRVYAVCLLKIIPCGISFPSQLSDCLRAKYFTRQQWETAICWQYKTYRVSNRRRLDGVPKKLQYFNPELRNYPWKLFQFHTHYFRKRYFYHMRDLRRCLFLSLDHWALQLLMLVD